MWNALHNAQHPRGAELQRKLQAGHALSDRDLRALHASPTANWWGQRDEKTSTCAMRKASSGYVLNAHELSALRNRAASRLPPIVVPDHSPRRSRPDRATAWPSVLGRAVLAQQPTLVQDDLGYQQRIALENNVTPEPALEDLHALSAPALDGPTAEERRAARDDRIRELQQQIRRERQQRKRIERSISAAPAPAPSAAAAPAMPDVWFEERDPKGRTIFIHIDGKQTSRHRPTQGKVYGLLSYLALGEL
jgi:hypothetical protein